MSVLFCDVTDSTALGESIDPESLQALLARYFERMSHIIARHGGTVEKFIGDAVMAVFGIPVVHEDDALRACRAAVEMRDALPDLGLNARIGVMTGEVMAGTAERLATGDAVNVAARLEQAAPPGQVLIGEATWVLVRTAVDAEPVEPMELKGKARPVPAYRLATVHQAPGRTHESPFVGRTGELTALEDAWRRALAEHSCQLVTIIGDAGAGKSRLVEEFLATANTPAVRGRCLPYGEGITYSPVTEVIQELGGVPAEAAAAATLQVLLGKLDQPVTAEEIAWAFRKLLEERAPLVCVFDDLQWAEPTLLDLIEHVGLLSVGAGLLIVCLARPELTDVRPSWPVSLRLDPLSAREVEQLLPPTLERGMRTRIAQSAGGNPLFVTEMLAMAIEGGTDEVEVPPTLQALLAARLDQLDPTERRVLDRGAVEGEVFHRGAVQALCSEASVTPRLAALVRRQLIRTDRPQLPGEDAFRFRHLLLRDAAYHALPKALRADLHERFAAWLDDHGVELVERDEIVGYHLEQAYRYRVELGQAVDPQSQLAAVAAGRLEAAGRRAMHRGDMGAALNLLDRARALRPAERIDVSLEATIVHALALCGRPDEAVARAEAAAAAALAAGDDVGAMQAKLAQLAELLSTDPQGRAEQLENLLIEARPLLESSDDAVLASVWWTTAFLAHHRCRFGESFRAAMIGAEHARQAGDFRMSQCLTLASAAVGIGPMPVEQGLQWLEEQQADTLTYLPWFDEFRSTLLAISGRVDEARAAHAREHSALTDRGMRLGAAISAQGAWEIEMAAGDLVEAERVARAGCEQLEAIGDRAWLSTQACQLAESLYCLGRYAEAEEWVRRGLDFGDTEDASTQLMALGIQAKLAARSGSYDAARQFASAAFTLAESTEAPLLEGRLAVDYAEVLVLAGDAGGSAAQLRRASELFAAKGATVYLERAARRLDELGDPSAP